MPAQARHFHLEYNDHRNLVEVNLYEMGAELPSFLVPYFEATKTVGVYRAKVPGNGMHGIAVTAAENAGWDVDSWGSAPRYETDCVNK